MDEASLCARHSSAAQEPLIGTVGLRRTWILVQDHGLWQEKAFKQSDLPEKVKRHLVDVVSDFIGDDEKAHNAIVLIRNSERQDVARKKLFVVHAGTGAPFIREFEWESPTDILRLPLRCTLSGQEEGNPVSDLVLVCTNGSRDRCCAKFGLPLYRALAERAPQLVWRSSHLGGHRFAPVVAWLPHGIFYGRIPTSATAVLLDDISNGKLSLPYFRGRATMPKAAQVAEALLRHQTGEDDVDAYEFLDFERISKKKTRVGLLHKATGSRKDLTYKTTEIGRAVMPSCGEDAHEPVQEYVLLDPSA